MKEINNYKDIDTLTLLFEEIEKHLETKQYISALYLSLSIPDILGQLEYPKLKNRDSYIKWFDENVRNFFGFLPNDDFYRGGECPRMDGEVCYRLRCKLYHQGINDIEDKTKINEFVLCIGDEDFVFGNNAGIDYDFKKSASEGKVAEIRYLYVSCKELIKGILNAAKIFVKRHPNKDYPKIKVNFGGGRISDVF